MQTAINVDPLLGALRKLEADGTIEDDPLVWLYEVGEGRPEVLAAIDDIEGLACDVLITDNGRPSFQVMRLLKQERFRVGPGEVDSFGWLTGVIYTRKGMIVYG